MLQKCWIKYRELVFQADYEEVISKYKKNSIVLLKNDVAYPLLPTIAPESSKDNPLVLLYLEVWITCDDEEVILRTVNLM